MHRNATDPVIQYIPRNMHTVFALLCFVVVIHWMIFPYPSGLLHWHCGNLTIAPVPAKQPRWIWINTSCEFIMNDCITTTKQSTTKPCAYFLGYTVSEVSLVDMRKTQNQKNRHCIGREHHSWTHFLSSMFDQHGMVCSTATSWPHIWRHIYLSLSSLELRLKPASEVMITYCQLLLAHIFYGN